MTDYTFLITGSRDWPDEDINQVEAVIKGYIQLVTKRGDNVLFRVGDCPIGVDSFIDNIILNLPINRNYDVRVYKAYWDREGKQAGPNRNQRMVNDGADKCLAFIYGASRGTRNCANKALSAGITVKWVNHV